MTKYLTLSLIGVICIAISFGSCRSLRTRTFWKECKRDASGFNDAGYYKTTREELRSNLRPGVPLFYVGTANGEDYFVYYYDAWGKTLMAFRIPESDLQIERVLLDSNDKPIHSTPVYPRNL